MPRLTLATLLFLTLSLRAEPNAAEAKLREQLRNTMLQLRTAQTDRDTLQAEKEALDTEKKDLTTKLDKLTKEAAEKQAETEKSLAETQGLLAKKETDNTYLVTSLEKWKAAHKEVAALAEKKEAARAQLNSQNIVLQRQVEDQRRKNQEMYKIGTEVLSRYENFGLGTAITAREPFVGTMKVKLQNLVQDYSDKLSEQRIRPEAAPGRKLERPSAEADPNLKRATAASKKTP